MIELLEPATALLIAMFTGVAWLIIAVFRHQRFATNAHANICARLERLEQWRAAHSKETEEYQQVLREVQRQLAYWKGLRDAGSGPAGERDRS